jgi:protein-tyrosine phosphatase
MAKLTIVQLPHPLADHANGDNGDVLAPTHGLKRVYLRARRLHDRLMHRHRHPAVRRRLSNGQRPRRMLVVCHGNICRSPYLQAQLQRSLPDIEVASAGFVGGDRPVPKFALTVSAQRGVDLSQYRSQPITQSKIDGADLVIVMDEGLARRVGTRFRVPRKRVLIAGDLDPKCEARRGIEDPWNQAIGVFEATFDRLDRCVATLVGALPPS